ncbi:MAG: hypothetical protein L3K15_09275 [Thermoplasmata archaeon]|nr:hypothetical protein [Thermoplasmata archaeon]
MRASAWFLLPMLGLVTAAVSLLLYEFLKNPVTPGVDPGHWLSIAYSYVGIPTAADPSDRPLFYSPLLFPFLGGLVVLTGSPTESTTIFAAALLATFGLTVVHLARRFLLSGPLQVLLVGLVLFAGTTYRMMFWGGYPNFLGFIMMNEAMIFFLLYVRGRKTSDAALFFGFTGLTYLAHDLTFFVLLAVLAFATGFLLLFEKISLRFFVDRRTLAGGAGLIGLVGGFTLLTRHLGISHASYFFGNPSAYRVDEVGEIFIPLGQSPMYLPPGPPVILGPISAVLILLAVPVFALLVLAAARLRWAERVDARILVAVGWLSAATSIPAVGYLARVQTDYPRFLFFIPLPLTLVLVVGLERLALRPLLGLRRPSVVLSEPYTPYVDHRFTSLLHRRTVREPLALAVTLLVVFLVFATVTWPLAQRSAGNYSRVAHDAAFMQACAWIE